MTSSAVCDLGKELPHGQGRESPGIRARFNLTQEGGSRGYIVLGQPWQKIFLFRQDVTPLTILFSGQSTRWRTRSWPGTARASLRSSWTSSVRASTTSTNLGPAGLTPRSSRTAWSHSATASVRTSRARLTSSVFSPSLTRTPPATSSSIASWTSWPGSLRTLTLPSRSSTPSESSLRTSLTSCQRSFAGRCDGAIMVVKIVMVMEDHLLVKLLGLDRRESDL